MFFWHCFIAILGNKMSSYKRNLYHQQPPNVGRGEGKGRGFFLLDDNFMQYMMVCIVCGFTEEGSSLCRTTDNPMGLYVRT